MEIEVKMLHGQGVVVTGGSRGIGTEIVRRLAAEGAGVVFGYHRDAQAANAVLDDVRNAGGQAWAVAAVVAYLAGPDAGWLTGQNIRADGGLV